MPLPSTRRPATAVRRAAGFSFALILAGALTGCGMFRGSADVGPDLKPHLGTSVSFPLGQ